MYLERLLFLITGAFVFLCLGFALIIMASSPAKRPTEQIAGPPAEVADAQRPSADQSVGADSTPIDKDAARQRLDRLLVGDPEYDRFFKRLREAFPVEFAAALDMFAARLVESDHEESADFYLSEAVRLLRQWRGVLAAKAEPEPLTKVFDVQLKVLRAIGEEDPHLCVAFLYGATDQDFARFASTRRPLVADMAMTGLEAIANGQAKKIDRAPPPENDFKILEAALLAKGLGKVEIDALLDGKMPDPPLEDARMCAAGQTYLETLHTLPDAARLRIYGLAMELMARS